MELCPNGDLNDAAQNTDNVVASRQKWILQAMWHPALDPSLSVMFVQVNISPDTRMDSHPDEGGVSDAISSLAQPPDHSSRPQAAKRAARRTIQRQSKYASHDN